MENNLKYKEILKFYLPLATAAFIMMFSNNIVNSVLSQTVNPKAALASFSVAFSYAEMIAAPCFSGLSMYVTLGKDRTYFKNTMIFTLKVLAVATATLFIFTFTPFGEYIATTYGGATSHMMREIKEVWKFALLLPLLFFLMATSRAVLLTERATYFVTISRLVRLLSMLALSITLPSLNIFSGATLGTIVMMGGMAVEVVASVIPAIILYRKWPSTPDHTIMQKPYPATQKAALKFLAPLMVISFMWGISRPILFSGLARMDNPELTIATYRVATNFIWLYIVFIEENTKQLSIAFLSKYKHEAKKVISFITKTCLIVVAAILLTALTPFGRIILENVIGVEPEMAALSTLPILALAIFPILQANQEFFQANLLLGGKTNYLGYGKVLNIIIMSSSIFMIAYFYPQIGAVAGALAMIAGMGFEMIFLGYFTKKFS